VLGSRKEGLGSSKSANKRFGGIRRDNLDSIKKTLSISRQPRKITIHLF
jgi:hypothetical protein